MEAESRSFDMGDLFGRSAAAASALVTLGGDLHMQLHIATPALSGPNRILTTNHHITAGRPNRPRQRIHTPAPPSESTNMSTTSLVRTNSRSTSALSPATPRDTPRLPTGGANKSSPSMLKTLELTPKKAPSTPTSDKPSPARSSPGSWQHPRMAEVIQRQNATRFDGSNLRIIGLNFMLLVASFLAPMLASKT
jgi:hypothetical protein